MEINRSGPLNNLPGTTPLGSSQAARQTAPTTSAPLTAGQFTPTDDLTNLLSAVRQVPEVRQELIGEMARKLSSGELFIPPAPEKTIGAILESGALSES